MFEYLDKMKKAELLEEAKYLASNQKVQDYHDFSHPDTPKELRDKLFIGDIYINGAECKECGYFIRSRNKHDYVSCKCGSISVDGGSHYLRRSGDLDKIIERVTLYNDVKKPLN